MANDKRWSGISSLSQAMGKIVTPLYKQHGFAEIRLITDWSQIVGKHVAAFSSPTKITFPKQQQGGGKLYIEVTDSAAALELRYLDAQIKEHIATYFGYAAISTIVIKQVPCRLLKEAPLDKSLWKGERKLPDAPSQDEINLIQDSALKEAVTQLGSVMAYRKQKKKKPTTERPTL